MVNRIELKNFGPLVNVNWRNLGRINLVIGNNGSGKTFLLKALYCSLKTIEGYRRGNDQRSVSEILANKLYWTFQTDKIGDLVRKGAEGSLSSLIELDKRDFSYSFGKDTSKQIGNLENHVDTRDENSIFLPAKEVLSLHNVILKSRDTDQSFGFDDTYYDLATVLRIPPTKGNNYVEFAESRKRLRGILDGEIRYDEVAGIWQFIKDKQRFQIGVAAEGVKKIGILNSLLSNRYLDINSIILIDEPESALHPSAISSLMDIVALLAERGVQFFLASHSYFVVKKLALIAQEKKWNIPLVSAETGDWHYYDLLDGMPDNPIIGESINLYKQEIEQVLG